MVSYLIRIKNWCFIHKSFHASHATIHLEERSDQSERLRPWSSEKTFTSLLARHTQGAVSGVISRTKAACHQGLLGQGTDACTRPLLFLQCSSLGFLLLTDLNPSTFPTLSQTELDLLWAKGRRQWLKIVSWVAQTPVAEEVILRLYRGFTGATVELDGCHNNQKTVQP